MTLPLWDRWGLARNTVVVGLQWSDEAKGKICDVLGDAAQAGVRCHGGAGAGHNIQFDGQRHQFHSLPSIVARPGKLGLVGPLSVVDAQEVERELAVARAAGSEVLVDQRALVVLPALKLLDAGLEGISGADAVGTTRRGIGPAHAELALRRGIRVGDVAAGQARIQRELERRGWYRELEHRAQFYGVQLPSAEQTLRWCLGHSEMFRACAADTRAVVARLDRRGERILWENNHGVLIDVVHGARHFSTSSIVTPWSAFASYGPRHPLSVIGAFRPYVTRVGRGPMPTEITDGSEDRLRQVAGEIESTTGAPQRCGWLDLVAMRFTRRMSGADLLVATKLDVFPPREQSTIKVCVAYDIDGRQLSQDDTPTQEVLQRATPVYQDFPAWDRHAVARARDYRELPVEARRLLEFCARFLDAPVVAVSNGPDRQDIITTLSRGR